ncbi:MAG: hypothetical protein O3C27_17320 [Actinomycetota bacterium]|nr:hypothetical protein [Actinomycetota bacterium]
MWGVDLGAQEVGGRSERRDPGRCGLSATLVDEVVTEDSHLAVVAEEGRAEAAQGPPQHGHVVVEAYDHEVDALGNEPDRCAVGQFVPPGDLQCLHTVILSEWSGGLREPSGAAEDSPNRRRAQVLCDCDVDRPD